MSNDAAIIGIIAFFFVVLGIIAPFIHEAAEDSSAEATYSSENLEGDLSGAQSHNTVTFWQVIRSIAAMFFWTFGTLPAVFDVILLVPRVVLIFIISRNIWIGGGG